MKQRYRMALEAIYSIVDLENYPKVELIKDIIEKALCVSMDDLEDGDQDEDT